MHMQMWQIGTLMTLAPVGVAWLLLLPLAIKLAAGFYKNLAMTALQFALQRRGELQNA